MGLSPRLRGNVSTSRCWSVRPGSIPALAGERARLLRPGGVTRVYPRACGGTHVTDKDAPGIAGLSPRLRGNVKFLLVELIGGRSIPALAGERHGIVNFVSNIGVYPRACGGTVTRRSSASYVGGLSPRLRGNGEITIEADLLVRSIPALAGERVVFSQRSDASWVYPRACGGTLENGTKATVRRGLSPRLRGNVFAGVPAYCFNGSIPALAGERSPARDINLAVGVYPRACGGTPGCRGR